jgi:SET domain-containing protein
MRSNAVLASERFSEEASIEVRNKDGYKGVFAKENITADSVIFYLKGTVSSSPTKYTIQLSRHRHLNFPTIRKTDDELDYSWQYLNHSCEPSGYMNTVDRTFRALRDLVHGEEISFNYLTTESAMAEPFKCMCGSSNCFGFIEGRDFLSAEQVDRLALTVGEDNVVTLLMPTDENVFGRRKRSVIR